MSVENKEPEPPTDEELAEMNKRGILERRDFAKAEATETQKEVAEIQTAKYETAILELMKRTNNNPDLMNNLNEFLNSLMHQAELNNRESATPIKGDQLGSLTDYFGEKAEELKWDVGEGERTAHRKPTWKWKGK